VTGDADGVGVPVHALVLDEQHLAQAAAQFQGADDPVVHQWPDVAVLPGVHREGGVQQALLLAS